MNKGKGLFILCTCLFSARELYSQKAFISKDFINDEVNYNIKVIGQDEEGFFLLKSNLSLESERDRIGFRSRKYALAYYNHALQVLWDKSLEPLPAESSVEDVLFMSEHCFMLSSMFPKGEAKIDVYATRFGKSGNAAGNTKVASFNYERSSDLENITSIVAQSQSLCAIMLHERQDEKQIIHAVIADSGMKLIAQKTISLPYSKKEFAIEEMSLSADGDIALLITKRVKASPNEKRRIMTYSLVTSMRKEQGFTEKPLSVSDKTMLEAALSIDNVNRKAVVTGFFADRDDMGGLGVFYAAQSFAAGSSLDMRTCPITGELRLKIIGDRSNNLQENIYYPIQRVILRNDGGAVLLAEEAFTNEYSYYDYFTQSFTRRVEYHYDNIFIISLNSDCTIDWSTVIRKNQDSVDDAGVYSSFCSAITEEKFYVVFNRDISRNSTVAAGSVTNTGIQDEKNIVSPSEHILIIPSSGKQISENEMIIPVLQKRNLSLAKIVF